MAQGIRPGAATWGQFFPAGAAASAGSEDSTRCRAGGSCDCNIFPTAASGGAETEAHAVYPPAGASVLWGSLSKEPGPICGLESGDQSPCWSGAVPPIGPQPGRWGRAPTRRNLMPEPSKQEIEARAYQLWEKAGRPEDREEEFWHLAQQELRNEDKSSPVRTPDSL